ncbi:esterase-like [Rosa rugosa]|uniref:esterase-like n=1 Tax=Rosa rugosa TaxID=74645 RepID=UPI002B403652|nr:esterase-like [Rosa rugosa]
MAIFARFELPLVACCGYGGRYNYNNTARCGATITVNGSQIIFVGSCKNPSTRVNWDGGYYTEAAAKFVFDKISTGTYSDPPLPLKQACHRSLECNGTERDPLVKKAEKLKNLSQSLER